MKKTFSVFSQKNDFLDNENRDKALLVFDTNILLNVFRISATKRKYLLENLEKHKKNIWSPHQVGLEFYFNKKRIETKYDIFKENYTNELQDIINNSFDQQQKSINEFFKKNSFKDEGAVSNLNKEMKKVIEDFKKKSEKIIQKSKEKIFSNDTQLVEQLERLFDGKIGKTPTKEQIIEWTNDGDDRYEKEIPPGYDDLNKDGYFQHYDLQIPKKFGDLILWKQILNHVKESNLYTTVIFITDDLTSDWFYQTQGRDIGARIELKKEMYDKTQANFFVYSMNSFLVHSSSSNEPKYQEKLAKAKELDAQKFKEHNDFQIDETFFEEDEKSLSLYKKLKKQTPTVVRILKKRKWMENINDLNKINNSYFLDNLNNLQQIADTLLLNNFISNATLLKNRNNKLYVSFLIWLSKNHYDVTELLD